MTGHLKVMLVAGEASGDLLGARLMAALRLRRMGQIDFSGIGGPAMAEQGLESLFPMADLSIMGLAEILPRILLLRRRLKQAANHARQFQPDVLILIDSPGFTRRLAKALRHESFPIVQYVAPTVWAWRPGRAKKLASVVDMLLALLPFEPPYFKRVGLETYFVGHPVLESGLDRGDGAWFRRAHNLSGHAPLLLLLPGSREGEIRRHVPIFGATLKRLIASHENLVPLLFTLPHLVHFISDLTQDWPIKPIILSDPKLKPHGFAAADAALAASGTVALELAMAGCPTVIAYKVNQVTAAIVKRLVKTPYASLPNILLSRAVQPELLQEQCEPEGLARAVAELLAKGGFYQSQKDGFAAALKLLAHQDGLEDPPSLRAADCVLHAIERGKRKRV